MHHLPRRNTLIRLAALVALPWTGLPGASVAQTRETFRVGLIAFGDAELREPYDQALIEGLRQRGYVEGKDLVFERRYAGGRAERLPEVASELAALKLDVIVTTCTPAPG